jgi:hypothetical protein
MFTLTKETGDKRSVAHQQMERVLLFYGVRVSLIPEVLLMLCVSLFPIKYHL